MDYQQKYLKYKKKYLTLQYELQGGLLPTKLPTKPKILLFDLDDTLYSSLNGFSMATGKALVQAMSELDFYKNLRETYKYTSDKLDDADKEIEFMAFVSDREYNKYAATYGISLGGLIKNCELGTTTVEQWQKKIVKILKDKDKDKDKYDLLKDDYKLKDHLDKLRNNDCELFIFTNSDDINTEIILEKLNLTIIFPPNRRITFDRLNIDIQEKIDKACNNIDNACYKIGPDIISKKKINLDNLDDKSHQTPFLKAIEYINETLDRQKETLDKKITPSDIIFFDDSDKNIKSALDTGLKTVYIQKVKKEPITKQQNIDIKQQNITIIQNPNGNPDRSELSVFLDNPDNLKSLMNFINK
jgi:FMN phosphatase YigB (HAD superfamily)